MDATSRTRWFRPPILTSGQAEVIKWYFNIVMVVQHAWLAFMNEDLPVVLSFAAVMAHPLILFLLVHNRLHFGRDARRQLLWMWAIALLAQYPYVLAFGRSQLNAFVSYALALTVHWLWDSSQSRKRILVVFGPWLAGLSISTFADYSLFGYLLYFALVWWFRTGSGWAFLATLLATWGAQAFLPFGLFAILAYPMLGWFSRIKVRVRRLPGRIFYALYPAHLFLFGLLK